MAWYFDDSEVPFMVGGGRRRRSGGSGGSNKIGAILSLMAASSLETAVTPDTSDTGKAIVAYAKSIKTAALLSAFMGDDEDSGDSSLPFLVLALNGGI